MPRFKHDKKVRLSLETSEQTRALLEFLRDNTNADSLTEVVRRSLEIYRLLYDARKSGKSIILRSSDQTEQTIIVS